MANFDFKKAMPVVVAIASGVVAVMSSFSSDKQTKINEELVASNKALIEKVNLLIDKNN